MAKRNTVEIEISATDKASSVLDKISGSTSNLGKVALAGLAGGAVAATTAVVGLGVGIGKMTLDAMAVEGTTGTFEALAESVGSTATQALEDLRGATKGMVADADLMAAGNKFMAMGLADSSEEAAKLAEVATQLGTAMGEDATGSMENFALMMANQSIPRLDSFGISSGKVRERIDELMESNADLSREAAFNTAVMEEAQKTMAKVGEQSGGASGTMARLGATFNNISLAVGQAFLPAFESILTTVADLAERVGPQLTEWAQKAGAWLGEHLPGMIEKAVAFFTDRLIPTLVAVAGWLKEKIPQAIETLKGFWTETLLPAISKVHGFITTTLIPVLSNIWSWLQEKVPQAIETLRGFWETTLLPALSKVYAFVQETLIPVFSDVWSWLQEKVPQAIETLRGFWETTLVPAFEKIKEVWEQSLKPALDELVGAFSDLWTALSEAWSQIQPALQELGAAFSEAFGGGGAGGEAIKLGDVLTVVVDVIVIAIKVLAEIVKVAAKVISAVIKALAKFWEKHGDKIIKAVELVGSIISTVFGAIKSVIDSVLKFIGKLVDKFFGNGSIVDTIESGLKSIRQFFDSAVDFISGLWDAFWSLLQSVAQTISDAISFLIDAFLTGLKIIFDTVTGIISGIWDAFWSGLQAVARWVSDAIKFLVDAFLTGLKIIFDTVTGIISGIWDAFWSGLQAVVDWVSGAISSVVDSFLNGLKIIFDTVTGIISGVWDSFWSGLQSIVETVTSTIQSVVDTAWNTIKGIFESVIGTDDTTGLRGIVKSGFEVIENAITSVFGEGGVGSVISTAWEGIKEIISSALSSIVDFINGFIRKVNALAGKIGLGELIPEIEWPPEGWPGARFGANFVVPPGFSTRGFPLLVHSGEHVRVTPAAERGLATADGMTMNFNTTVNTPFDFEEFVFLVQEALRELSNVK